jgi:DNA repair exonuclease SbcCD ATPase subunit
MKILSLTLKNFKGIKSFTLDTRGGNTSVYGDNATGKTTLADALYWLLFDKDSQNRKDFDIKTITPDGQVVHGLEHSVEGIFDIDGQKLTLKKVFTEKWTKKRGSAEKQFTGHTTDHYIDGVPVKKKEYTDRVSEIADESIFKLLTSPTYFNTQLHWQERRNILLQVCGDVSDQEVIESDKDLAKLPDILQGRKLEDHRKVIAARRSEINKELERIPVRIDEVTQGLPELPAGTKTAYENELNILTELKSGKEREKLRIESGGEIAEKRKALAELDAELQELKNGLRADIDAGMETERSKIRQYSKEADNLKSEIEFRQESINGKRRMIEARKAEMDRLRTEWETENARQFEYSAEDTCPTCGQTLPAEQIEAARQKALEQFNTAKAEKLQRISHEGKTLKARVEELEAEIAETEAEIARLEKDLADAEADKAAAQARLVKLEEQLTAIEQNEEYQRKLKERQALADAIAALEADSGPALEAARAELAEIEERISSARLQLQKFDDHARGQARIEELKARERELAAEFESLEEELYLTEQFIRCKVKLLEDKINSRFEYARFKLFEIQVNGGISECCETTYKGVPYGSSLNNAARINVGLDIINTLSDFYNFYPPIFIDNREAVTQLIDTRAQVISLVVSEPDKELRVEYESDQISQREAS